MIILSSLPDTMYGTFRNPAKVRIGISWPNNRNYFPLTTFHTLIVLSQLPEKINLSS